MLFRFGRVIGVREPGFRTIIPLALQLRNLQSLVEIGVDKNTAVVFPAPLMTTIAELGSFLARESAAAGAGSSVGPVATATALPVTPGKVTRQAVANGSDPR